MFLAFAICFYICSVAQVVWENRSLKSSIGQVVKGADQGPDDSAYSQGVDWWLTKIRLKDSFESLFQDVLLSLVSSLLSSFC